jgi:hypothetical protein
VFYQDPGSLSIIGWFFELLAIGAMIFEGYAFVDVMRRPKQAFLAAQAQNKPLWLVITGVATVIGLGTAATASWPIGILAVAAFVAAAIYLTNVKPKIKDYRASGSSGTRMGPYGPW